MKSIRKIFLDLHLWLSVPFGIVIALVCFTGAMLVFEDELTRAARPQLYTVEPQGRPLDVGVLADKVAATLPEGTEVSNVIVTDDPREAWRVSLSRPKRAAVMVNQYTGEVLGRSERLPFFTTVFRLHRWLMDSRDDDGGIFWGKIIVGVSTLAFVIVLVTGIVVWWPRTVKALRTSLKLTVRHGWFRLWHGLHVAGGVYAFVFLLAMAVTGLTWSFPWWRTGFYALFGVSMEQQAQGNHGTSQGNHATAQASGEASQGNRERTQARDEASQGNHERTQSRNEAPQGNRERTQARGEASQGNRERTQSRDGATQGNHEAVQARTGATQVIRQDAKADAGHDVWQRALDEVVAMQKDTPAKVTVSDGKVMVACGGLGNARGADTYAFDRTTGEVTDVQLYADQSDASRMRGWIWSVHTGAWGGWAGRILAFLAALLGASLPLTGYYLWIRRLLRRRK